MSGRILEGFIHRSGNGVPDATNGDQGEVDDLGSFGWLRGIRDRALTLELRQRNGNIVAIPYHTIERFEFDPSEGIALTVTGQKVRLKGQNLNAEVRPAVRLFEGLTRYRVSWVQETDSRLNGGSSSGVTVVDAIDW